MVGRNCIVYIIHAAKNDIPPIYRWIVHCLQNGSRVIYSVEAIPELAIAKLIAMNDEVRRFVENETLQVIDPESLYSKRFAKGPVTKDLVVDEWLSIIGKVADGSKDSSILVISTPELLVSEGVETLQTISAELDKECNEQIGVICCYNLDNFYRLSLGQAISLMSMNERNMRCCAFPDNMATKSRIMNTISKGLDKGLGKGSGRLIFSALGFLYKLDIEDLLADPYSFETKLRKIIGDYADRAIAYILSTIEDELIFSQQYLMQRPRENVPSR